jgi:hypothetical protein
MLILRRLQELLDAYKAHYEVLTHSEPYTVQDEAHSPGSLMANVVMTKMRYEDYVRLVHPKVAKFAEHL